MCKRRKRKHYIYTQRCTQRVHKSSSMNPQPGLKQLILITLAVVNRWFMYPYGVHEDSKWSTRVDFQNIKLDRFSSRLRETQCDPVSLSRASYFPLPNPVTVNRHFQGCPQQNRKVGTDLQLNEHTCGCLQNVA